MTDQVELRDVLKFERYPRLNELLSRGGMPGVDYLIAPQGRYTYWYERHWEQTKGVPTVFYVNDIPAVLLCRGVPAAGMGQGDALCHYSVDTDFDKLLGIEKEPVDGAQETTEAPAETETVLEA